MNRLSHYSQDSELTCYQMGTCDLAMLEKSGIAVRGTHVAQDNYILLNSRSGRLNKLSIDFSGSGNIVVLKENSNIEGQVLFRGNGNLFICEGHPATPDQVVLYARFMEADESEVIWGKGSTSNGAQIVIQGSKHRVTVGSDCMFASGIWLRASDMHSILDLATGEILNPPQDITIGRHVWVGQEVLILKGSIIGDGAVVGARALVTGSVKPCSLVAGSPARTLKENVSWSRNPNPTMTEIEAIKRYSPPSNI